MGEVREISMVQSGDEHSLIDTKSSSTTNQQWFSVIHNAREIKVDESQNGLFFFINNATERRLRLIGRDRLVSTSVPRVQPASRQYECHTPEKIFKTENSYNARRIIIHTKVVGAPPNAVGLSTTCEHCTISGLFYSLRSYSIFLFEWNGTYLKIIWSFSQFC